VTGKWDGRRCSTCGVGVLHDDSRERSNEYRGRVFRTVDSGAYCDRCGDGVAYYDPQTDEAWEMFCSQVDTDERRELAAIRAQLGLTQEEASRISGGGHNAFSRYERGEAQPVMAVLNLFRLLGRYPSLLREFSAMEVERSRSPSYTVSEPITEGWGSAVAAAGIGAITIRVPISIESGAAANEWHIGTGLTGLALEAA
jgi:HTH-type transcriptional regulator/antitoxin MqsA